MAVSGLPLIVHWFPTGSDSDNTDAMGPSLSDERLARYVPLPVTLTDTLWPAVSVNVSFPASSSSPEIVTGHALSAAASTTGPMNDKTGETVLSVSSVTALPATAVNVLPAASALTASDEVIVPSARELRSAM